MKIQHKLKSFSLSITKTFMLGCMLLVAVGPSLAQERWSASPPRDRNAPAAGQSSDWMGTGSSTNKTWRLGIVGTPSETGVLITEIAPNSAAERARIEKADIILAVEGYQVGTVGGRLYDLTEEVSKRADESGRVSLLIQDHNTGRLAAVRVQLDGNQSNLSGTVEVRGTSLPNDAMVTVQIENVTRPHFLVKNGLTHVRPVAGRQVPFEITYDPSFIDAQDAYRAVAFVSSGGRTIMEARPQEVITRGKPSQLRLVLEPVGSVAGTTGTSTTVGYSNYSALDSNIDQMYRKYLGRAPTPLELSALRQTPGINSRLSTMPLDLMASQEYFDKVGNNNSIWLRTVFQEVVKRQPTQDELLKWMQFYENLRFSRTELLRELSRQAG